MTDYCCATGNCPRCQAARESMRAIGELFAKIKAHRSTPSTLEQWNRQCEEIYATPGHVWLSAIEVLMDRSGR